MKPIPSTQGPFLVTGATGFLGRHLLETTAARQKERRMCALVRSKQDWEREDWTTPLAQVQCIEGQLTTPQHWISDAPLSGLAGIFHFAALVQHSRRNQAPLFHTNVEGTLRMVRLAAEHRCRLIYVSTSGTVGVFDNEKDAADEEAPYCSQTVERWPYYTSKIEAEKRARLLANELGVDLVIVRPPVLLGPGDHRFRSSDLVRKHLTRRMPFLIDGGMHFIDIRDAVTALLAAMEHPSPRGIYHLPGTSCRIDEFFDLCEQVSGVPAPRRRLPFPVAHALAHAAEKMSNLMGRKRSPLPDPVVVEMGSHYWGLRSLYAAKDLGYASRPPLQTVADTVDWLRRHETSGSSRRET